MSGKHDGNQHKACPCPYCWLVYYSQGALTNHVNKEHWKEKEAEEKIFTKPSLPTVLKPPVILKGDGE